MSIIENEKQVTQYRKEKILDQLDNITNMAFGKDKNFKTYINSTNGDYSESNTNKFIDRLIEILQNEYKKNLKNISPDALRMYRSFLYCSIRLLDTGIPPMLHRDFFWGENSMTIYDNILWLSDHVNYACELNGIMFSSDEFFSRMDDVYEKLTDNNLWCEIRKDYIENKISEKERKEYEEFSKMENSEEFTKAMQGECDTQSEKEIEELHKDNAFYNELRMNLAIELEQWKNGIKNPEEICKQYELFVEMYLKIYDADLFKKDIEKMITTFIVDENISLFSDEEKFLDIYVMLRRIERKLNTYRREDE